MILLDGLDKQIDQEAPKLVAEASTSYPVARAHTPTPSLPDYEASQAQLRPTTHSYPEIQQKRTRRRRCRKYTIYALTAYFVLTVVIGIPILVVKLKPKVSAKTNPYQDWVDNAPSPPTTVNLGDTPLQISAAQSCNSWNVKDRPDGSLLVSELEYQLPVNGTVFVDTNITYSTNTTYLNQFAGTLLVAVNDDASQSQGVVQVTMHHTTTQLGQATNVCLMQANGGHGLYVFAPKNLNATDALIFNITLLLPQNNTSPRNIPSLLCHMPHFQHTYQQMDPQITFDSVIFGGAMSGVYVESVQANSAIVKASSAEVRGTFKVTQQLSLETVSAPLNVDAHLYYDPSTRAPTFMHLTTGNSILNANVTLYVPAETDTDSDDDDSDEPPYIQMPHFITHAETFNAPLNVEVMHDASSQPSNFHMRAINNLGTSRVGLDSMYSGTFDVVTMFSQADVLTWDGTTFDDHYDDNGDGEDDDADGDDDTDSDVEDSDLLSVSSIATATSTSSDNISATSIAKVRMFLPSVATASAAAASSETTGRCLEYDLITSSEIRGWVGIPPRPSPSHHHKFGNMSHVQIVSSLNSAQLVLEP